MLVLSEPVDARWGWTMGPCGRRGCQTTMLCRKLKDGFYNLFPEGFQTGYLGLQEEGPSFSIHPDPGGRAKAM